LIHASSNEIENKTCLIFACSCPFLPRPDPAAAALAGGAMQSRSGKICHRQPMAGGQRMQKELTIVPCAIGNELNYVGKIVERCSRVFAIRRILSFTYETTLKIGPPR
jgi:hypothetical protein